eukprot:SAG31_NODE_8011_length_1542_cov_0.917533_1_plen_77_part_00
MLMVDRGRRHKLRLSCSVGTVQTSVHHCCSVLVVSRFSSMPAAGNRIALFGIGLLYAALVNGVSLRLNELEPHFGS